MDGIEHVAEWPEPARMADGDVIADYAAFSGLPVGEILAHIADFRRLNRRDFEARGTLAAFYAESRTYVFDLLSANWHRHAPLNKLNRFLPGCLDLVRNHPGRTILEFGGGTGVLCQGLWELTHKQVTYLDLPGHISDFAQWRFNRYGIDVPVILAEPDRFPLTAAYDVILTDAVWEHMPPPQQAAYAARLPAHLPPGGVLLFLVDLTGPEPDMPMHFAVDIGTLHGVLQQQGLVNLVGLHSFASVWLKPPSAP